MLSSYFKPACGALPCACSAPCAFHREPNCGVEHFDPRRSPCCLARPRVRWGLAASPPSRATLLGPLGG
eukprot:15385943-Alexandrium_andersonii.AAC.1